MESTFPGFPVTGLQFLADLAANNNKTWFDAHKAQYEKDLLQPAQRFVSAVGERLQAISPAIQYDTRTNGSGSLMRIYRDTRFSQDKTPYKTNITGMWWEGAEKKTAAPAFGFQLTTEGMGLMAGMFGLNKEQLALYRAAVLEPTSGARLAEIANETVATDGYELAGLHYKRVPRGFPADHPHAELLRFNALYAHLTRELPSEIVTSSQLVERCCQEFQRMAPVQRWLVEILR